MGESGSKVVECPHCGEWVSAGLVCEDCGKDLEGARAAVIADEIEEETPKQAVSPKVAPSGDSAVAGSAGTSKSGPPRSEAADNRNESSDYGCPDFRLLQDSARFFLSDQTSSFAFELEPLSTSARGCRNLELSVHLSQHPEKILRKRVYGFRESGPAIVRVNFSPARPGVEIEAEVRLRYDIGGGEKVFIGSFLWDCLDPHASSGSAIENLIVDLKGNSANTAADQNIRILEGFTASSGFSPVESLSKLKLEPVWTQIELFPFHPGGETEKRATARLPLTLIRKDGFHVHLLGFRQVCLGRGRGEGMIRTLPGRGTRPPVVADVMGVSRCHSSIRLDNGAVVVADGHERDGVHKPSSNGSLLDGKPLASGQWVQLPKEESALRLGKEPAANSGGVDWMLQVLSDVENGRPAGVVLRSRDREDEVFVLARGRVDLASVLGEAEQVLLFSGDGFGSLEEGNRFLPLQPGSNFQLASGRSWRVSPFSQIDSDEPRSANVTKH